MVSSRSGGVPTGHVLVTATSLDDAGIGSNPECSTRKSFAASSISVPALYADAMAKSEPKDEAFER